ncbi:MAG TPA: YdeI/OmpD-associated family protein [Nakamurella sp.]
MTPTDQQAPQTSADGVACTPVPTRGLSASEAAPTEVRPPPPARVGILRRMKFHGTLLLSGKTATGIEVPPEVVSELGSGKKPAVTVTINGGYTYRSSVASMSGRFMLPVSGEHRAAAGLSAGDEVDVELELDTQPRELTVPEDLSLALDADPAARSHFDSLSYSNKLRHVLAIEGAKTAETRARRVAKLVALFHEGRS